METQKSKGLEFGNEQFSKIPRNNESSQKKTRNQKTQSTTLKKNFGEIKGKKAPKIMETHNIKRLEIINEQSSFSQSDNESSLKKTQRPKNPRHPSGAPEKITSKILSLLNMSFGFLSKEISIYEA